ncbi:MAG: cardiolipin synthase [Ruminococcus sp.]|nr:cardiolipin synthase [Ruminococcus sp.]
MKKKIKVYGPFGQQEEKVIMHIPFRYILAMFITAAETAAVLAIMYFLALYIPHFWIAIGLTVLGCILAIINADDNPDYKLPWLVMVMAFPIVGFMIYFMYYSRKLPKKYVRRLGDIKDMNKRDDSSEIDALKAEDICAYRQAVHLKNISGNYLYRNTRTKYYPLGEDMFADMLTDLKAAEHFIFMEYFIIEEGLFWNSILDVLKEKAAQGVEVKVMYDDIGCMTTLPGNYARQLQKLGIDCVPFARLRGQANNEFNNRSHRKITSIDGRIAYTGGVNIADEYINKIERFGHWKDTGLRMEGEAARELTMLFLGDYAMNRRKMPDISKFDIAVPAEGEGYMIPFGSGPRPMYERKVGQAVIENMLNNAKDYIYMTTPYLIIDNELTQTIENAALRGVDVRIITPHIPDKKLVFGMTRSSYKRLMDSGVRIYEYEPGFIHAKMYVSDDTTAMIGTINLDYRSLVHHFENGVWLYKDSAVMDIKRDILKTCDRSIEFKDIDIKDTMTRRFVRAVVKIFAPML